MMYRKKNLRRFVPVVMTAGVQTDSKNILLKEGTVKTLKLQMSVEQIHRPLSNCE